MSSRALSFAAGAVLFVAAIAGLLEKRYAIAGGGG